MPNTSVVDQRVVEMRIDNQKFESGAKKTINTLDKLDKSLNGLGSNSGKGLDHFSNALSGVTRTLSALGDLTSDVFSGITTQLSGMVGQVERMVRELTIDQVAAGWDKYGDKTQGVQTIMAATAKDWDDQAAQMEWVNAQLERLNWFTDETSYNFLDMVNNIGKFTSNGVQLESAVTAMQGIATWAAISGANTVEASRAMYNMSQAMGTGKVMAIDWKSIENANMATKEFKQVALETAAEYKTLIKLNGDTWRSTMPDAEGIDFNSNQFRDSLKEDWFTSEVLVATLEKYGKFANELKTATDASGLTASEFLKTMRLYEAGKAGDADSMEKFNEMVMGSKLSVAEIMPYIEKLTSAEFDLGRRAFQAAQEAKTFKEAIDATKDAVSTSWMNLFEKMFGNYLEAKVLWTNMAESLYNIFAEPVNLLNGIFDTAFGKDGPALTTGRELLAGGIMNILYTIETISEIINTAIDKVFSVFDENGDTLHYFGECIYYAVERFHRFTKGVLEFMDSAAEPLSDTLATIIRIIRAGYRIIDSLYWRVRTAIGAILSGIIEIFDRLSRNGTLKNFGKGFLEIFYTLRLCFIAIDGLISGLISRFITGGRTFRSWLKSIDWVEMLVRWITILGVKFRSLMHTIYTFLDDAMLETIPSHVNAFVNSLRNLYDQLKITFKNGGILGVFKLLGNKIKEFVTGNQFLINIYNGIAGIVTKIKNFVSTNPVLLKAFNAIKMALGIIVGGVFMLVDGVTKLFSKIDISKITSKLPSLEKISNFFTQAKDFIKLRFESVTKWFESFKNFDIFGRISGKVVSVFNAIKNFFTGFRLDFSGFTDFFGRIREFLAGLSDNMAANAKVFKEGFHKLISKIWGYLVEEVNKLSFKDIVDLLRVSWFLSHVAKAFAFIDVFRNIGKQLSSVPEAITGAFEELKETFKSIGQSFKGNYFLKTAIAIGIVAASIYALSKIDEDKLMRATGVIVVIGIVLTKMSDIIFGKKTKIYNKQVDIRKFQLISNAASFLIGLGVLILAVGIAVAKVANAAKTGKIGAAFFIIAGLLTTIGVFILLIVKAFNKIKTYKRINAISNTLMKVAASMAIMAVAVRLLVKPLLQIAGVLHKYGAGDNSVSQALNAILLIAGILGIITVGVMLMLTESKGMTPAKIKAIGNTLLKISGSMAIMAVAVRLLVKPLLQIASAIHRYGADNNSVGQALNAILLIAGILGIITVGVMLMLTESKGMTPAKINAIGNTLLKIAGSMAIMAIGVRILVKPLIAISKAIESYGFWKILGAFAILALVIAALSAISVLSAKNSDGKSLLMTGAGLALFAVGLAVLLPVLMTFIAMSSGIFKIISGLDNFGKVLGRLGLMTAVLIGVGVAAALIGVGMLAAGAGVLLFATGLLVLAGALSTLGPAMSVFVQGLIDAGALLTKDNLINLGKGVLIFLTLAVAVTLLVKALGKLDSDKISSFGASIGKLGGTLIKSVTGIFSQLGTALLENLPNLKTVIISLITIIGLYIAGAIPTLVNTIGNAILTLVSSLYYYIKNNKAAFEYYIFGLVGQIMSMLEDAIAWGIRMIIPFFKHIIWETLGLDSLMPTLRKLKPEWADKIESFFTVDENKLQASLQSAFDKNASFWESANPFGDVPPEIHEITEDQAASLGLDIEAGLEKAKEDIAGSLSDLKDTTSDTLSDVFTGNAQQGTEYEESATGMADFGVDTFNGALDDRSDDIFNGGYEIGAGVADGMLSSTPLVSAASEALADAVQERFRDRLFIRSPSRLMAKLAGYIPAGVAKGIEDNSDEPVDSMSILSSAVMSAMEDAMAHIAALADEDFTISPTITPVVDLSNYERYQQTMQAEADKMAYQRHEIMVDMIEAMNATVTNAEDVYGATETVSNWSQLFPKENEKVVGEIQNLSGRVDKLGDAISNMKIVLDTGVLVGATSSRMDTAFGIMQVRKERGN